MKRVLLRVAMAALLCGASAASFAHRFNIGIAEVSFNESSGSIEVVHTYMAHDIDAMLATLNKRQVDLTRPDGEALLRAYVEKRFYLVGPDKSRLPLKWVGISAGVDSVTIYQELENTAPAKVARVHDEVLLDVLPRQVNTVNVKVAGAIRSLAFDAHVTERKLNQ